MDYRDRIKFRYASKDDIKTIAELEPLIFSDPWTEDMVRADIEAKISRYLIAELSARDIDSSADERKEETHENSSELKVVGYIGYWLVFDECSINNVAVVPELQGNGIGSLLMEEVIRETEKYGANVWILEVRAGNEAAISLYEKFGFQKIAIRKKYYGDGEDAVMMHRYRK